MMRRKLSVKLANLLLFLLFILLFVYSDAALLAAKRSIGEFFTLVFPALFPYMILSALIVRHRLLEPLCGCLPIRGMFGLPSVVGSAFLLGAVCGFPVGVKTVVGLYENGDLTKTEAERASALCNNTGPAFAVMAAGVGYWGSRSFGWWLYGAQMLGAVLLGLLSRRRGYSGGRTVVPKEAPSLLRSLTEAIPESVTASLAVAGYIVFFAVVSALLGEFLPPVPYAVCCAILEFTAGIRAAAGMGGLLGRFLTGFSLGFSGLSVLLQCNRFTAEAGLSLRCTVITKLIQGVVTGGFCVIFGLLWE